MLYQIKLKYCLMIASVSESVFKAPDSYSKWLRIFILFLFAVPSKRKKEKIYPCQYSLFSPLETNLAVPALNWLPLTTQISLIIGVRHRAKCFKGIFLFNLLDNPGRQCGGHC